jgi:DNA-binding XRE family transcriptional regulator
MEPIDIRALRESLGLSQAQLASLVGFSIRTIQSCEQGWRKPSPALEKMVLLLYLAQLWGTEFGAARCWEVTGCPPERRNECVAYLARQGHLCWFLTGTLCHGQRLTDWRAKRAACAECDFFRRLMTPPALTEGAPVALLPPDLKGMGPSG